MKSSRRHLLLAGTAFFVIPSMSRAAATLTVHISAEQTAFEPPQIEAKVGDTVEWINESIVAHTVTCDPAKVADKKNCALPEGAKAFDSGDMEYQANFTQVFTVPGTYRYFCIPHENMDMVGTVVVT